MATKETSNTEIRISRGGKTMMAPIRDLKKGDEIIAPWYPHLVCVGDVPRDSLPGRNENGDHGL